MSPITEMTTATKVHSVIMLVTSGGSLDPPTDRDALKVKKDILRYGAKIDPRA